MIGAVGDPVDDIRPEIASGREFGGEFARDPFNLGVIGSQHGMDLRGDFGGYSSH